ncbi:MAG TPA: transglutaminase domain-containing protein [Acidimicrobiales bacterium]|nr:transglutaminase domain-containing protein [Acidimicrobiales bacterium]
MATTLTPPTEDQDVLDTRALLGEELLGGLGVPEGPEVHPEEEESIEVALRPLLVAGFAMLGTALTVGGIFGSWSARLICVAAAAAGIGWSWVCARSRRRAPLQMLMPVVALGLAVLSLIVGSDGGPAELPTLVRDAIEAGRALRPPIPFDAGWRPILIAVMFLLGFAAGSAGTTLDRPRLALVIPLPLLGLTAISQPPTGQALAGLLAVVPVIAGLTVLFGDQGGVSGLTREFEFRRILKAVVYLVGILAVVLTLNSTSLLFPEPAYDPAQKPQKPKPVPLNAADDRVLFEVSGPITGPWKVGSLDDYDGTAWRLPPYDPKSFQAVPASGVIDKDRKGDVAVTFTVRDFGTNASLPGVTGPTRIDVKDTKVVFDERAGSFRVPSGRVPTGLNYTEYLPTYPTPEQLQTASPGSDVDKVYRKISPPPPAVRLLLEEAPSGAWDRLDYLLKKLNEVEVAVGTGAPKDIKAAKVQDLLTGSHEGSPYELVAAQAMLARWAGVPSRIGFGFDGAQQEGAVLTVRPKNASQWLEVYFESTGWVPIVTQPPRAKASLDNEDAKFNPTIQAGDDVAVQIYVPVKVRSYRALYQQVRDFLQTVLPLILLGLAARLATPWARKTWRRSKRQRWAREHGPGAQIAVEYCEYRDLATDLGVGDPFATPIEFLDYVVEDHEHEEFAWLVTKALYGELYEQSAPQDVAAARELSDSLRARLFKAQPLQTRVLSYLTRLSLQQPYSTEVPN